VSRIRERWLWGAFEGECGEKGEQSSSNGDHRRDKDSHLPTELEQFRPFTLDVAREL